jgi:hypothetical protein
VGNDFVVRVNFMLINANITDRHTDKHIKCIVRNLTKQESRVQSNKLPWTTQTHRTQPLESLRSVGNPRSP